MTNKELKGLTVEELENLYKGMYRTAINRMKAGYPFMAIKPLKEMEKVADIIYQVKGEFNIKF